MASPEPEGPRPPFCVENWRLRDAGASLRWITEYPLYTDAHLTGHGNLGPFALINTVPVDHRLGLLRPAVVLRVEDHFDPEGFRQDMTATDDSRYHAGTVVDEVAALLSLAMGARFKPGSDTRLFSSQEDRFGSPRAEVLDHIPQMFFRGERPRVPNAAGPHRLAAIEKFTDLVSAEPKDAIALVRAARAHQEALWLSESDPQLTWLLLVSAVETVANRWHTRDLPDQEVLKTQKPDFFERLRSAASPEVLDLVAAEFARPMRATWRFIRFLLEFRPPPPEPRASSSLVAWDDANLKRVFAQVYDYRSRSLHGGTPFPAPMCDLPYKHGEWAGYAEVPMGLAGASMGGVWLREDAPVLLWTFEYIARAAVLEWWRRGRAS